MNKAGSEWAGMLNSENRKAAAAKSGRIQGEFTHKFCGGAKFSMSCSNNRVCLNTKSRRAIVGYDRFTTR